VAACGDGVTDLTVGQQVYGLVGFDREGGAAEYVAVPASDLAAKPVRVDHQGAASLALAGLTAWQALVDHAKLTAGQHVLVHGGAGGVGNYTVQLAAAMGATVTATAAARDAGFVATLGADEVLDYAGQPFEDRARDVDVVVDTVGGDILTRSLRVLRPGGTLVGVASAPPQEEADERGVRAIYFVVEPSGSELAEIARLVDTGLLNAKVGRVFPLAAAAAAFDAVDREHVRGKVVLSVRPSARLTRVACCRRQRHRTWR
jgi:NADPH:quinone reductase-like Zn-dependent oxidoreductase